MTGFKTKLGAVILILTGIGTVLNALMGEGGNVGDAMQQIFMGLTELGVGIGGWGLGHKIEKAAEKVAEAK